MVIFAKLIRVLKWLAFIPGVLLWYLLHNSIGNIAGIVFGVFATLGFWFLMHKGELEIIGERIVGVIRSALKGIRNLDSIIEVKSIHRKMLVRIYLIGESNPIDKLKALVDSKLGKDPCVSYILAMQIAGMKSRDEFASTRVKLDTELFRQALDKVRKPVDEE